MNNPVAASYRACHDVVRRSGSNFALAFWLLPHRKRLAMNALYAFARHTDDLGDDGDENRLIRLNQWREQFRDVQAGGTTADPLLPAVMDTVRLYSIPTELLEDLITGVERDQSQTRYETWKDLRSYCYQVAGTVGLACIHVWGFRGERVLPLAKVCGEAFQLTNILRDVKEDAARDRIYLPQEDLKRCGYTEAKLQACIADESFDRLMEFQLSRAEELYAAAAPLHDDLSREGQRVFRLMFGRYRAILAAIRREPRRVLRERVSLSLPSKLWIAGRKLLTSRP